MYEPGSVHTEAHMRASHADRESVFAPPANLANILATIESGGTFSDAGTGGRYGDGYDDCMRYDDGRHGHGRGGDSEMEAMIDEAQRDAEVSRMQADHLGRQLKGAVAELALHKRHAQEFKAMLEAAEADLAASHEHSIDLGQKLQLAQEGNRRNADMAQQLLTHLNTARVELKAQTRKNAQLQNDLAALQDEGGGTSWSERFSSGSYGIASSAASVASTTATSLDPRSGGLGSGQTRLSYRPPASVGSGGGPTAALERFCSRAMLTPVTHDVGVQVERRSSRNELQNSRMGSVALLALQHARELESVHRELTSRIAPAELVMERRPGTDT